MSMEVLYMFFMKKKKLSFSQFRNKYVLGVLFVYTLRLGRTTQCFAKSGLKTSTIPFFLTFSSERLTRCVNVKIHAVIAKRLFTDVKEASLLKKALEDIMTLTCPLVVGSQSMEHLKLYWITGTMTLEKE